MRFAGNKPGKRPNRPNKPNKSNRPERPSQEDRRDGKSRPRPDASRTTERPREQGMPDDLCWGRNPVISLLEEMPARCLKVVVSKTMQRSTFEKITELCKSAGIPYSMADSRAMDAMVEGENHQGVVATLAASDVLDIQDALALLPPAPEPALVILFDHIQDPHNLGAMIRSAEAVGAVFAAVPLRRSSLPTGTVVKTSAGASLRFPIATVGNVANAVRAIQDAGLWCIGLDADAKNTIYSSKLPARTLIVVGAEGKGLTRTTETACDELLSIPITGGAGSLNASVALGVAMFEWSRQNKPNNAGVV